MNSPVTPAPTVPARGLPDAGQASARPGRAVRPGRLGRLAALPPEELVREHRLDRVLNRADAGAGGGVSRFNSSI